MPILTLPNGDANRDGVINDADYALVESYLGTTHPSADLNGDGKVNDEDLAIVKANKGLESDAPWSGNFPEPHGWYRLQFAVQLDDYAGNTNGLSVQVRLQDSITGQTYAVSQSFLSGALTVLDVSVPTPNPYVVQVQAPAGGSWLTITRKEVQASAPVPNTFGAPFPWQGSLPVPNGVVNIWNGNLHLGLSLFGWGGQAGVAFGLFYNAQDTRQGILGVGWRHSYEASLEFLPDHNPPLVVVNEPDGRRLAFAQQPDGSYVPMRGVYSQLRYKNGQYELIRPSQVRWVFDSTGRLIAIRDLHNQGVSLSYDSAGRLAQITDSVGRSATLSYYQATDVAPGTNFQVPQQWVGKLKSIRDVIGREWQFAYHPQPGLPTVDEYALLAQVIFPDLSFDGTVEASGKGYRFGYSDGKLSLWQDREGYRTSYGYQAQGDRCVSHQYLGRSGGDNQMSVACPVVTLDERNMLGGTGRVFCLSQGEAAKGCYAYDALGRLVSVSDALGRTTQMGWNGLFQLSWVRSPSGAVSSFCWDERGNLTRTEDPLGNWVELEWNALNRLSKVRDALTPAGLYRMIYEHTPTGDLVQAMALAGEGTNAFYANTLYVWDVARGLLLEAWDAEGHRTQKRVYDSWGYLQQVQDALGRGGEVLQRNALGWVERVRNARGQEIEYRYDSWGRLREKVLPNNRVVRYQYDLEGRLLQMTEPGRETVWTYQDTTGFLQSVAAPEGVVEYEWQQGLLHKVRIMPAGGTTQEWRYQYNDADELEKVYRNSSSDADPPEVVYVRDGFGRLRQVRYGNGTVVEYTYDNADRVRREEYKAGSVVYRRVEYVRDGLGRISQKQETVWSGGAPQTATTTYTYDHQGQLIREVRTGANPYTIAYTYDLVGNRLTRTRTVNGQTFTDVMAYNAANQLESLNNQAWQHDLDGNVVVRRVGNESWLLDYDAEGNLVSLQRQGDSVGWVYEYDGLGRRVRAVRGSLEVVYLYSGDTLVAEGSRQRSSDPLQWVYYGYGGAMYQRNGAWQHWDVLGNRVASSDTNGQVAPAALYDAFGDRVNGTADFYDWNGVYHHRTEPLTGGLVAVGRRWYDPTVGRFLQRDPMYASPVYAYCWNDPIQLVDILGLKPGDKYKSPDAAAKAAIRDIWDKSQREGVEYGGWIYKNPDGTYSYTAPVTQGDPWGVNLGTPPNNAVGHYHIHPGDPPGADDENFSPEDREDIRKRARDCPGFAGYLGTPSGVIKKYVPGKGDSAIGRVR